MSRCFPYPPPGYCRNAATYEALIESIKKETVKAVKDKSERKREKREKKEKKEKKRREKRKDEEKQLIQKNPNEFQPNSQEVPYKKTELQTVTESRTEQLEKSDLTEEHCEPLSSQKPSYSSDSTQNSNKRKRDDVSLPEGSSGHGKPIKIRLLKKHKPDSSKETLCTNSGRSDSPCFPVADARLNLVSSNRTTGIPVTSGRGNIPVLVHHLSSQTKLNPSSEILATKSKYDNQGIQFSTKQSAPSFSARPILPLSHSNKTEVSFLSRSKKSDVEVIGSISQQPISTSRKPFVTPSQHGISRSDLNKTNSSATGKRPICEISAPGNSGPTRFVKRKEDLISEIPNNVLPGISGPTKNLLPENSVSTRIDKKINDSVSEIPKKVPTRHEKKLQKKYFKYEKLIGSWVPPVLEAQLPVDDEDWLSRRGAKITRSSRDDVETNQELAASSLWQPRAQFLVEDDIYALPYTVPF